MDMYSVHAMFAHNFNESTYTFIGRSNRTDARARTVQTTNIKSEDETLNSHFILLNGYEQEKIQPTPMRAHDSRIV